MDLNRSRIRRDERRLVGDRDAQLQGSYQQPRQLNNLTPVELDRLHLCSCDFFFRPSPPKIRFGIKAVDLNFLGNMTGFAQALSDGLTNLDPLQNTAV